MKEYCIKIYGTNSTYLNSGVAMTYKAYFEPLLKRCGTNEQQRLIFIKVLGKSW